MYHHCQFSLRKLMVQLNNNPENGGFNAKNPEGKVVGVFCYLTTPDTSAHFHYVHRCAQGIFL